MLKILNMKMKYKNNLYYSFIYFIQYILIMILMNSLKTRFRIEIIIINNIEKFLIKNTAFLFYQNFMHTINIMININIS